MWQPHEVVTNGDPSSSKYQKLLATYGRLKIGKGSGIKLNNLKEWILKDDETSSILLDRLQEFARILEINHAEIKQLEKSHQGDDRNLLYHILKTWRAASGIEATVEVLHNALIQCGVRSVAETVLEEIETRERSKNIKPGVKAVDPRVLRRNASDTNAGCSYNTTITLDNLRCTNPLDTAPSNTIHKESPAFSPVRNDYPHPSSVQESIVTVTAFNRVLTCVQQHKIAVAVGLSCAFVLLLLLVVILIAVFKSNNSGENENSKHNFSSDQESTSKLSLNFSESPISTFNVTARPEYSTAIVPHGNSEFMTKFPFAKIREVLPTDKEKQVTRHDLPMNQEEIFVPKNSHRKSFFREQNEPNNITNPGDIVRNTPDISTTTPTNPPTTDLIEPPQTQEQTSYRGIRVRSSSELETVKIQLQNNTFYNLQLDLNTPLDWEGGYKILNADRILFLHISGPLFVDLLLDIVSQTPNLKWMILKNSNLLCQINEPRSNQRTPLKNVLLDRLVGLLVEDFGTCSEIYNAISTKMGMVNLKELTIRNSNIDSKNHPYIQALLEGASYPLTNLSVKNTAILLDKTKVLFDFSLRFPNLKRLDFDFLSPEKAGAIYFGTTCEGFSPNLKKLTSDAGRLPWSQLKSFLPCKELRVFNLTTEIHSSKSYFNVTFIKQHPKLQAFQLNLYSEICKKYTKSLKLVGLHLLSPEIEYLIFTSNCKLKYENVGPEWMPVSYGIHGWFGLRIGAVRS